MHNEFYKLLELAKQRVDNKFVFFEEIGAFSLIYPFTTENINGYIDLFELKNKSLLTVGSSGDQVINASLKMCNDITVIDVNPFTKYYFYLKKAALLTLNYEEFTQFFCYEDYPKVFKTNYQVFNLDSYKKIKSLLKELDKESFIFFDELFNKYNPIDIRKNLFSSDEDRLSMLKGMNLYLKDKNMYNKTKVSIKNINPIFITGDLFKLKLEKSYDNIYLSNLCAYFSIENLKSLIDKLYFNLNENGKMLIGYLYKTTTHTKYKEDYQEIYDLNKTFKILGKYITYFESFTGVQGLKFEDKNMKDSVMIYHKKIDTK